MARNTKVAIEIEIKNIKQIADLKQELKDLRKEQREQEKRSKSGQFQSHKNAEAYKKNAKAIREKSKELRGLNKRMSMSDKETKKVTKSQNSMAKQFVKGAAALGIIVGAFRTVSRTVGELVRTFTEFEFVMAKVNAVSGATDAEFKGLTETAEELGRTTFFTAAQVGELMLNFSKLGFTAQEIQNAVEPTLNLATATGSDLARSATVAGAAVRGFGLDASETSRVVDVMAVAFAGSALDIEKFQTSMTKVAPIAKSAGFSIEDTTAMMAKLTDAGIEASIAGTSLRNILLKMQDPTSELSQSFGGTIHSLDELVPAMEKFVLEGGSMADVMEVVDLRQAAAFETLLMSADGLQSFRDELNNATGEGERMAGMIGDTLQGSFLRFKSAVQGLSIAIMKNFGDSIKNALNRLANWLNSLAENEDGLKKVIERVKTFTKVLAAFFIGLKPARALMVLFAKDVAATGTAMTLTRGATIAATAAMRGLKIAIASTGIGLLIIALGELVTRLMFAKTEQEKLNTMMDDYGRVIVDIIDKEKTFEKIKEKSEKAGEKELAIIDGLIAKYKDENTTLEEQQKILKKLERINSDFFGGLQTGVTNYEDLEDAAKEYKKELVEIARVEAVTNTLAGVNIEIVSLESKIQSAIDQLAKAHDLNDDVKAQIESDFWSWDLGESWEGLKHGFLNMFDAGKQGDARKAISETADKIKLLKIELEEAKILRGNLEERLEDVDLEKLLGLDMGDGNTTSKFQQAADFATMLNKELNEIKKQQLDGTLSTEEAAKRIIKAQMDINRQEYATLKESQKNGKRGVDLQSKYLDDKLKLLKLNREDEMALYKSDYADEEVELRKMLLNKEITQYEFNQRSLENRKQFLEDEMEQREKERGDKREFTLKEHEEFAQLEREHEDVKLQIMKNKIKEDERILKQDFDQKVLDLKNEQATTQMSKLEFNNRMLILEAEYLNARKNLYAGNALELIDIENMIQANTIKVNKTQKQMLNEQMNALSGVGSAMVSLAGDNEKLNAVKEAGNKINQIANTIQAIQTLRTNLQTIAEGKLGLATLFSAGAKKKETAATVVSTGATTADTAVTGASLGVDATKAALSSGKMLPWPINLIAFAASIILIRKILKMFEKGGVVDEFGLGGVVEKFANGGMVMGKSHAQGGEKFQVGGRVVELEGGEAVINKRSTAMYRSQLSAMNEAGGGVKFADGGLMNLPQFANQQFTRASGGLGMQKVIVVESDITQSQRTVNVLESQATI